MWIISLGPNKSSLVCDCEEASEQHRLWVMPLVVHQHWNVSDRLHSNNTHFSPTCCFPYFVPLRLIILLQVRSMSHCLFHHYSLYSDEKDPGTWSPSICERGALGQLAQRYRGAMWWEGSDVCSTAEFHLQQEGSSCPWAPSATVQSWLCFTLSVTGGTTAIPHSFKYRSASVFAAYMTGLLAEAGQSCTVIEAAAAGQHGKSFRALYHYLEAIKVWRNVLQVV